MQHISTSRALGYQFDSLAELSRYISDTPRTWSQNESKNADATDQWDLGAGYDQALYMAANGWLEGAREAEAALAHFVPRDPAPDCVTDFYGHMPHVPRFCAGAPDSMIRHSPKVTIGGGRVLTLYVAVCANGFVKAECMKNFGLGIAQYINEMETVKGIRCELYGACTSNLKGVRVSHTWRIKHADQPLDLPVLAFSIGHPAMLRRLEFALCERSGARECFGYGSASVTELTDLIDPPAGAFVLNGMTRANEIAKTPADALEYVASQIDKLFEQADAA